jgi:hypothetical protein
MIIFRFVSNNSVGRPEENEENYIWYESSKNGRSID